MLPTGHFAAGYLTTRLTIAGLIATFPQASDPRFWAIGLIASVIPDLDEFVVFYKVGRLTGDNKVPHRKFISHSPLLHLAIGAIAFLIANILGSQDWQLYSVLYVVGIWTHFVFDSFGYGIMWLWPFTPRLFSLRAREQDFQIKETKFFAYWLEFLKIYSKDLVFWLELIVIAVALVVFLNF
ncbi:MAG: hypothetical protein A2826_03145 [Candidatus Doudnabacteria bacterium RIFCSPHIGHO2_01_FULL_43_23]|uniref:Metal-dependent hydrolase n=1 Tax=Candidatus Doudnabacteria bacterium RIFCSPHIGHO2_01_FULL_43_23 TaxID=1817822 RepID=A0A1F5NRR3_9BACT|nr:MAG: hypothetical protein A2826_03145 [Candidatus Doudnabacteria bacterium RIFCSPHIGHO2_01_FULL_43_23]